jgi:hypothetical protein
LLAYIPILFPERIEFYLSISQIVSAFGFLLGILKSKIYSKGPISGSLFYALGGYITPFLVFGTLTTIIAIIL